jgi:hypothetical protein
VWKPFECAASPRIAWNATGLPVTVSCSLPHMSVQAIGNSIFASRAVMRISCARRRIASAGMRVMPAAHSGVQSPTRSLSRWNAGLTTVPWDSLNSPSKNGSAPSLCVTTGRLVARSHHSLFCGSKQPSSFGFGADEHAELVARLVHVHELPGIRVADQELAVVEPEGDQVVDQREQQRAVGAGLDRRHSSAIAE